MFESTRTGLALRSRLPATGIYVSALTIAEIVAWCERNEINPQVCLQAIKKTASILDVTSRDCENAGANFKSLRKAAPGIGIVDAIIYAQARSRGMEVLTGDNHFRSFPGVKFVEKEK